MPAAFLNPWMLAALAAVSIPLIIELLHRRRRRIIHFPALRYLLEGEKQKKVRLQDLILLVLRSLLIFVLVLALARPILRAGSALWAGGGERDVVLVLDGTYSTGQRVGATSAFEVGKKMADQIVRSMAASRTPRLTLVYLGHKAEVLAERSRSAAEFSGRVERLRVSDGAGRMGEALDLVREFVERNKVEGGEVYVISDLQETTWTKRAAGGGASHDPAALLSQLAAKCRLFVLDTGARAADGDELGRTNYYLTRFEPRERVLATGVPVSFDVRVEGVGPEAAGGRVALTLYVDGQKRGEKEVTLSSAEGGVARARASFTYAFQRSGEAFLKVVLEGDSLPVDNKRYYLCRVPEAARVLIFDERRDLPFPEASSDYLRRAIAPERWPGFDKFTVFETVVRRPAEIIREELTGYAVVVLAGVRNLTGDFVARLETYVREGGRLLVLPGEGLEPYVYNNLLFKDGAGLLPARLGGPPESAPASAGGAIPGLFLSLAPPLHGALAHFKGRARLHEGAIRRYVPIEADGSDAETVMRLTNGEAGERGAAGVVERRVGRGRTMFVATSVDGRWGDLPFSRDFPVLLQELLRHLIGDPDASVNLDVGGRFEQRVFHSPGHLKLVTPVGHKVRVTPTESPSSQEWRLAFDDTAQQGLYRVDTKPEVLERRRFVVNLVPEEGDLAAFDAEAFEGRFGVKGLELLDSIAAAKRVVEGLHSKKELGIALLWILFVLLFVETYLAKRFGLRRV